MLPALFRKARADTLGRWFHTSLILLVISIATATVTLAVTIHLGAAQGFAHIFEQSHGAHVWFTAGNAASLAPLRSVGGVVASNDPFPAYASGLTLNTGGDAVSLAFWGLSADPLPVGRPILTEGRWLGHGAVDEIVLDAGLARMRGLKVGDRVEVAAEGGSHTLTLVGLAVNSGRPSYPASRPALGYVLPETLARFEPDPSQWAWMLGVRVVSPDSVEYFMDGARQAYPPGASISATPWQWVRDEVNRRISLNLLFLGVFGVFALIAVALVIVNLVGGYISGQVREIGLLKTIGFTPGQVTGLFILEYVGLGSIAAFAGALGGLAIAPAFLGEVRNVLGAVPPLTGAPLWLAGILGGMLALLLALTFIPALRGGQLTTVQAFAARVNPEAHRSLAARTALRLGLPPSAALGVRDIYSQPLRSILTFSSLMIAIVTMTFMLSTESTLRAAAADPTLVGGLPYLLEARRTDVVTGAERMTHTETLDLLERHPEIDTYLTLKTVPLQAFAQADQGPELPGFVSQALGGDYQQFRWYVVEGRMFSAPGEAVITGELADQLGVRVGDEISLRVLEPGNGFFTDTGKTIRVQIVGRYMAIHDGGRRLLYGLDTYHQQVDASAQPDGYGLKLVPGGSAESIRMELEQVSGGRLEMFSHNLPESLGLVRITLAGLTATLLMIAGVNLLTTLLFAVRERRRDFGILKTVGFTPAQVVTNVLVNGLLLGLGALIIGGPVGLGVTRLLFNAIGDQLHLGRGIFSLPDAHALMLLIPVTFLLVLLGSILPAMHAAGIRVVEVLRQD